MNVAASAVDAERHQVDANGIDIHYFEAGQGEPLILLHRGVVSTNLIWEGLRSPTPRTWGHSRSTSG